MMRTAETVRQDIFNHEMDRSPRSLLEGNHKENVHESLYALVTMIVEGPGVAAENRDSSNRNQAILTIAQLQCSEKGATEEDRRVSCKYQEKHRCSSCHLPFCKDSCRNKEERIS